jgi:hypothetical protein
VLALSSLLFLGSRHDGGTAHGVHHSRRRLELGDSHERSTSSSDPESRANGRGRRSRRTAPAVAGPPPGSAHAREPRSVLRARAHHAACLSQWSGHGLQLEKMPDISVEAIHKQPRRRARRLHADGAHRPRLLDRTLALAPGVTPLRR